MASAFMRTRGVVRGKEAEERDHKVAGVESVVIVPLAEGPLAVAPAVGQHLLSDRLRGEGPRGARVRPLSVKWLCSQLGQGPPST